MPKEKHNTFTFWRQRRHGDSPKNEDAARDASILKAIYANPSITLVEVVGNKVTVSHNNQKETDSPKSD